MTTLRTLIATLKTGVHFVRSLLAALPAVRRLLAAGGGGGSVDVVRESIVLLAMCRQVWGVKAAQAIFHCWSLTLTRSLESI